MLFDFLVVFVFLIVLFGGYRKGFLQMLISLCAFLFSAFVVWGIFNHLGDIFLKSNYGIKLIDSITNSLNTQFSEVTSEGSDYYFLTTLLGADVSKTNVISQVLAEKALMAIISVPLLAISFVLLKILLFYIRRVLSKTTALPVIGGLDSILGALVGALIGIAIVIVLYFVMGYVQFLPSMNFLKQQLAESYLMILINSIF